MRATPSVRTARIACSTWPSLALGNASQNSRPTIPSAGMPVMRAAVSVHSLTDPSGAMAATPISRLSNRARGCMGSTLRVYARRKPGQEAG